MKKWELYLGRPRSPRFAFWLIGITAVLLIPSLILEKMGYVFVPLWKNIVIGLVYCSFVSLPVTMTAYGSLAALLLLVPVLFLFPLDTTPEKTVWFWCLTVFTTVTGGIGIVRAARVRKLFERQ